MSVQIYAARWVWPGGDAAPLPDAEVVVEDGRIAAVRPRVAPAAEVVELGDSVLMPGLVNAHTHLEYTALRGFLEDVPFFPWVRALTAAKAHLNAEDWLCSARLGALETVAGGVTTIGDNTDAGATLRAAKDAGLRGVIFQEVFGIDDREPVGPIMDALRGKVDALKAQAGDRLTVGVSPHAPYTIRPALFAVLRQYTSNNGLRTSIHIAESLAESELTEFGTGPFARMYQRRGITWDVPHITPTQYVVDIGALNKHALAVHCIHQTAEDIAWLAGSGAAIVHCPKSNAKLGAGVAPLSAWLRVSGLRVALGTDSAVSNNGLDLWEEMRFALLVQRAARENVECVTARDVLKMATLGGAQALGLDAHIGTLEPGKAADLCAVRLGGVHTVPVTDPLTALVYSARASDVCLTVCGGDVLYKDGHWHTLDAPSIVAGAVATRARLLQSN